MIPSQLSFLSSLGGTPTLISLGSPVQKSFLERFFDQSELTGWERDEPNLEQYFEKLENAGYTISDTQIVFGSDEGESWPVLISPEGNDVLLPGLATGERGSKGIGTSTMISYLQRICRMLDQREKTRSVGSAAMSSSSSSSGVAASSVASSSSSSVPKSTKHPTPVSMELIKQRHADSRRRFFDGLNLPKVPESTVCDFPGRMSLSDIRKRGLFLEDAGVCRNDLTARDFIDADLFVIGGQCVVTKSRSVLLKDEGITILPMAFPGLYDHGNNEFTDVPCDGRLNFRTTLTNLSHIEEMLPYLNALVKPTGS